MIVSEFLNGKFLSSLAIRLVLATGFLVLAFGDAGYAQTGRTGPSGLPLPRFVSLKSDKVNVRVGPSRDHDIAWTFVKEGLPVEIIQEFDNWRRIRDHDGADGWIFHKLLSGRRTGLVDPTRESGVVSVYKDGSKSSGLVAWLEPKVVVNVSKCDGTWCRIDVEDVTGWMSQAEIFGVYPNEKF